MTETCVFCRIVRGEVPAAAVAGNEEFLAFRDINPQAPVHILIVPRAHVASLDDTQDAGMVGRLTLFAAELARREGIAASGYRTVINTHDHGGQTVDHLHIHLLGGRALHWPPG